jgi:hypothetical protein
MVVKEQPILLKIDPYLATHMDERGTHVVVVVSYDLRKRKHITLKKVVVAADFRTVFQAASASQ